MFGQSYMSEWIVQGWEFSSFQRMSSFSLKSFEIKIIRFAPICPQILCLLNWGFLFFNGFLFFFYWNPVPTPDTINPDRTPSKLFVLRFQYLSYPEYVAKLDSCSRIVTTAPSPPQPIPISASRGYHHHHYHWTFALCILAATEGKSAVMCMCVHVCVSVSECAIVCVRIFWVTIEPKNIFTKISLRFLSTWLSLTNEIKQRIRRTNQLFTIYSQSVLRSEVQVTREYFALDLCSCWRSSALFA